MTDAAVPTRQSGGLPVSETEICSIEGGLSYRGYAVEELAANCSFLEAVYLLIKGDLPAQEQLADLQAILSASAVLDDDVLFWIERMPLNAPSIDVLRTTISLFALSDNYEEEVCPDDVWETLARLLAQLPLVVAAHYRGANGLKTVEYRDDLSYVGNLLWSLTDHEPSPVAERAMEAFLLLSAEHELTPSTFATRIAASTRSDFLSGVIAGISVIKGIWHGVPGRQMIDILEAVEIPAAAPPIVRAVLKQYERMPGFWHRVYRTSDPRSEILRAYCREVAAEVGMSPMEEVAAAIESAVWDEQKIMPSFDWSAARLLHYLGLDSDLFVPVFVIGRCVGWAAHFVEQQQLPQPIRPRANYVGTKRREFRSLSERG